MHIINVVPSLPLVRPNGITSALLSNQLNFKDTFSSFEIVSFSTDSPKSASVYASSFTYRRSLIDLIFNRKYIQPDTFFIFHSFFHLELPLFVLIAIFRRLNFVILPHGSLQITSWQKSFFLKLLFYLFFGLVSFKFSNGLIFLCEEEQVRSIYPSSINAYILPNVTDPSLFCTQNIPSHDSHNSNSILYFGRFDINHKGLDLLADFYSKLLSFAHINDLSPPSLSLVGASSDAQIMRVQSLFNNHNSRDHLVSFQKSLDYKDRLNVFSLHKFIVLTSRYEGIPMAFLEAVSLGLIPIVSVGSNMARLISQYKCGFVVSDDNFDSIAYDLLMINQSRQSYMQKQALKMIQYHYSKEAVLPQFIRLVARASVR